MNLPNKLTLLRIFLVLPILLLLLPLGSGAWAVFVQGPAARVMAIILFVLAALTDFVDGYIARKYNLITDFGKLIDSLADKILVLSVFIAMVQLGRVHALIVVVILLRELLVTGIRQLGALQGEAIAAGIFGKWKAFCQMITLVYLLAEPLLAWHRVSWPGDVLIALSFLLTILSGWEYVKRYGSLLFPKA